MLIIFEMILSLLSKRPNQCAFNDSDAVNVEIRFSPTKNTRLLICADNQPRYLHSPLLEKQCLCRTRIVLRQVRGFDCCLQA